MMSKETLEDRAPEVDLLYLPTPISSEEVEKSKRPKWTFGYVPATKPRDLRSVKEFFVGNPYFLVPLCGFGGVLFSLVTAVVRLRDKSLVPRDSEQRLHLERRFMSRMDLMVKFKIFTFATGSVCYLYYELYLKKSTHLITGRRKPKDI